MSKNEKISGVNVCGFVRGEFGLAEAVRSTIRSLETQNIPMAVNNFEIDTVHRQKDQSYQITSGENPFPINIIQINGDVMSDFRSRFKDKYLEKKYNIGYWVWELSNSSLDWISVLHFFDELWVPSNFCVEAFSSVYPLPVLKVPYSISVPEIFTSRTHLNLPPDKFIFLFIFDFESTFERKNPLAIVEAFKSAFGANEQVLLVVKSINGKLSKEKFNVLKNAAADSTNIKLIDGVWDKNDLFALIKNCDCYVSLHRSEGFGLTIAEAMFWHDVNSESQI